jgi:hypothetical protein
MLRRRAMGAERAPLAVRWLLMQLLVPCGGSGSRSAHEEVGSAGWADCSGTAPDSRSVQRALRRLAMQSHPDRVDGSDETFHDMTELRDALKDPDRFQIQKLLRNLTDLTPFGVARQGPRSRVVAATVALEERCQDVLDPATCFPAVRLRANFSLGLPLPRGAAFTFALGAASGANLASQCRQQQQQQPIYPHLPTRQML